MFVVSQICTYLDRIVQVLDLIDEHLQRALSVDAPRNVHSALQHVGEGGSGGREAVVAVLREVELKFVLFSAERQDLLLPINDDVVSEESDVLNTTNQ